MVRDGRSIGKSIDRESTDGAYKAHRPLQEILPPLIHDRGVLTPIALAISSKVIVCSETGDCVCVLLPSRHCFSTGARLRQPTSLLGASIVPRDSVFTHSTSVVERMFPLKLIFPPSHDDHVARRDESWRP